jgi:hypothetical protein
MDIATTVATPDDATHARHRLVAPIAMAQAGTAEETESIPIHQADGPIYHLQVYWHLHLFYPVDYQHLNSLRRQREPDKVHQLSCTIAGYRL